MVTPLNDAEFEEYLRGIQGGSAPTIPQDGLPDDEFQQYLQSITQLSSSPELGDAGRDAATRPVIPTAIPEPISPLSEIDDETPTEDIIESILARGEAGREAERQFERESLSLGDPFQAEAAIARITPFTPGSAFTRDVRPEEVERQRRTQETISQGLAGELGPREFIEQAAEIESERPLAEQIITQAIVDPLNALPVVGFLPSPGAASAGARGIRPAAQVAEEVATLPAPVRAAAPSPQAGIFGQAPTEAIPLSGQVTEEVAQVASEVVSPITQARQNLVDTLQSVTQRGPGAPRQTPAQGFRRITEAQDQVRQAQNNFAVQQLNTDDVASAIPTSDLAVPSTPLETGPVSANGEIVEGGLQDILRQFREVLQNPARAEEWKQTLLLRSQEMGRRSANMRNRVNELVQAGVDPEQAINIGTQELAGVMPTSDTPLHQLAAPSVRDALFQEVYTQLADEPLEMRATATALANALAGKPIPRTPGTAGGSAYSRLLRVFGDDLTQTITQRRSLEEVIALETQQGLGLVGPTGRRVPFREQPPTQVFGGQQTARLVPEGQVLQGQQVPEALAQPPGPFRERIPDLRSQAQRDIDLQVFREATGGAVPPTGSRDPRALQFADLPPDDVVRQASLINETTREQMTRWARNAGLTALDFGNLMRASLASVDLSYLRQQALLIPGNPRRFAESFGDALRALFSENYARQIENWIRTDPDMRYYDLLNVDFLRPLEGRVGQRLADQWERAEDFMILGGNRPLQRLAENIPWIRVSGRAYITGMNSMNFRIWKGHMRMLHRLTEEAAAGRAVLPDGFDFNRSSKQFGDMLADFSGRGPVPQRLRPLSPLLNNVAFSLRLNIGRLLTPRHLFASDKFTRQAAWKNLLTGVGTIAGIVTAGNLLGWWRTEYDPRSSDFMKMIIGNTRVDPWGGFQQFAVLYSRLLPFVGGIKSASTGEISDFDPIEGGARFARNKAAPVISQALMAWTGKDFIGREIDRKDWQFWLRQNTPLAVQDIIEAYESEGLVGLALGSTGILGFGVLAFEENRNGIAQEMFGMDYDDLPESVRAIVREELNARLSPEERLELEQTEEESRQRSLDREAERERQFFQETGRRAPSRLGPRQLPAFSR